MKDVKSIVILLAVLGLIGFVSYKIIHPEMTMAEMKKHVFDKYGKEFTVVSQDEETHHIEGETIVKTIYFRDENNVDFYIQTTYTKGTLLDAPHRSIVDTYEAEYIRNRIKEPKKMIQKYENITPYSPGKYSSIYGINILNKNGIDEAEKYLLELFANLPPMNTEKSEFRAEVYYKKNSLWDFAPMNEEEIRNNYDDSFKQMKEKILKELA